MATVTEERPVRVSAAPARAVADVAGAGRLDGWVVTALCAWIVGGVYLDVWAHLHVVLSESFVTPWHAALYSGMLATTAYLAVVRRRHRAAGIAWSWTRGYGLSLTGCCAFAAAGVSDGVWHTVLGIETGLNGLISPPHVGLVVSAGVVVSGPLRVAWSGDRGRASWPAVISAALTLSFLMFLIQFDHPVSSTWAAAPAPPDILRLRRDALELGILGVLVQTALLGGLVLVLVSRFRLPPGALALTVGLNGLLISAVDRLGGLALVAVAMGAVGDLLLRALAPSPTRPVQLRLFAALWPAVAWSLYFLALLAGPGIWWPLHVWTGTVLIAGAEGWLLSHLVAPGDPAAGRGRG
jgi:hypothetical protein